MATAPIIIRRAGQTTIPVGGTAINAVFGPVLGGKITNPQDAAGQGIPNVEVLFYSLTGPAVLFETATCFPLQPGQSFDIPEGLQTSISVNAATSGHQFSAYIFQTPTPYPPIIPVGPFPPSGPTGLIKTIPAYLYQQYNDDEDLQAFVRAYNELSQEALDWFNTVGLPVYTGEMIIGDLLDWVLTGLYGIPRPALSSGKNRYVGPFNTFTFNQIPLNFIELIGPSNIVVTTDDIYKRVATWALFKADGKLFNIRWLKRRIMRFLLGTNGISYNVDQTYQVSVTLGLNGQVNITLVNGMRTVTGGAIFNRFAFNSAAFNQIVSSFTPLTELPNAEIFKEAVDSGTLELPFQFTYVVNAAGAIWKV